jgi:hypothetical protein
MESRSETLRATDVVNKGQDDGFSVRADNLQIWLCDRMRGPSAELAKSPPMTQSEHTSPYPPFLWRDTVSPSEVEGGRMRRREFILGIVMLVNVGR